MPYLKMMPNPKTAREHLIDLVQHCEEQPGRKGYILEQTVREAIDGGLWCQLMALSLPPGCAILKSPDGLVVYFPSVEGQQSSIRLIPTILPYWGDKICGTASFAIIGATVAKPEVARALLLQSNCEIRMADVVRSWHGPVKSTESTESHAPVGLPSPFPTSPQRRDRLFRHLPIGTPVQIPPHYSTLTVGELLRFLGAECVKAGRKGAGEMPAIQHFAQLAHDVELALKQYEHTQSGKGGLVTAAELVTCTTASA